MKLRDKAQSFIRILQVRFLNKRIPLGVRFQLTNRCTLQCKYCNLWHTKLNELSTGQVTSIIDQLARLGTKRISFSGGEPLLRKDIKDIIIHCREKDIYPEMNTNGSLVPEMMDAIRALDFLKISLDGPEEVHDLTRGSGSYSRVISAADAVYKNKINFGFATTLTKFNIDYLAHPLDLAKKYNTIVAFQPLKQIYRGVRNIEDLSPAEDKFKKAINNLINEKKSGNRHIRNSLNSLHYIYNWPRYENKKCWAGRIFCIINANADLYPCDRISFGLKLPNCVELGVEEALNRLFDIHCGGCGFCGSSELNYLMDFRLDTLSSIKKIVDG